MKCKVECKRPRGAAVAAQSAVKHRRRLVACRGGVGKIHALTLVAGADVFSAWGHLRQARLVRADKADWLQFIT
jgi:hypothetical protein